MIEAGILTEAEPVELLRGLLVLKMPKNRPHTLATLRTRTALERLALPGGYVDSQEPVTLSDSEPEPDVCVFRGRPESYPDRQPGSQDTLLVVEVSESTLDIDQGEKMALYAAAGIPAYWIINLIGRCVEVYADPDGATYASALAHLAGEEVPVVIDGREAGRIAVSDLLP